MGFLDGLFGKKEQPRAKLDHPKKLNKGDMISLDDSFALPSQLRGQQLQVEAVHTYEYENSQQTEWLLKGHNGDSIFFSLDEDDETYLVFSIKLTRAQVEQIFDLDQFSEIFEQENQVTLDTQTTGLDSELEPWLAKQYHLITSAEFGYFHRQDYRGQRPPQDAHGQKGEAFEAYQLMDSDEDRAVDIEVYEGGDTEVMLTLYRPLTDIRDYWPGNS